MQMVTNNGTASVNITKIQTNGVTVTVGASGNPTNSVYTKLSANTGLLVTKSSSISNNITLLFNTPSNGLFTNLFVFTGVPQIQSNYGAFQLIPGTDVKPAFSYVGPDIIAWPFQATNGGFSIPVTAIAFSINYQWLQNGTNYTGPYSTSSSIQFNASNPLLSNRLGNYQCIASNAMGASTSSVISVTYASPAVFTTQPQSQTVMEGSLLSMNYAATGTFDKNFTYWYRGASIASGVYTNNPYSILQALTTDAGNYTVHLYNYGNIYVTSQVATVTVLKAGNNTLWKGRPFTRVLVDGMQVPGFTNNLFNSVVSSSPATFRDGTVHVATPIVSTNYFAGIFRWRAGQLQTLLFTNTLTPTGGSFNYGAYPSDEGGGKIDFSGNTSNELGGFFELQTNGTLNLIVSTSGTNGTPVPNRPGYVFHFAGPYTRRGTSVVFASVNITSNTSGGGIYYYDGTNLTKIADDQTALPSLGSSFYNIKYDGSNIVFSVSGGTVNALTGGFYKATPQGVITKLADSSDFRPGSSSLKFTNFADIDVDGDLVFAIGNKVLYKFEQNLAVTNIGLGSVTYLSAAGPRLAYYGNTSTLYRWSDTTNEVVLSSGAFLDGKIISQIAEADGQGDDVVVRVLFTDNTSGIYVVAGNAPATPAIVSSPANVTALQYGTASFQVVASGQPPLSYQWFNGISPINAATNSYLTLKNVQPSDASTYYVRVTDANGASISSTGGQLTVFVPAVPIIITNIAPTDVAYFSSNLTFTVTASGQAPLSYTWYKDGVLLNTPNSPQFILTNIFDTSIGNYTVVISNPNGAITNTYGLITVYPVITNQPVDTAAPLGSTVTLSVGAIGIAPLTYQWYHSFPSSLAIPGATNATLSFTNFAITDTNRFLVTVRGPGPYAGTAISPTAILTVLAAPTITSQPTNVITGAGSNATFRVVASGTQPLSYQWRSNTVAISGATNSTYSISNLTTTFSGSSYSVQVTNIVSSVLSSNALLTVTNTGAGPLVLKGTLQGNLFAISFASTIGQAYVVEFVTNASVSSWLALTNVTAIATNTTVYDDIRNAPQRFYRARLATNSSAAIVLTGKLQSGQILLSFNANIGKSYTVEYGYGKGVWNVLTNFTAQGTNAQAKDSSISDSNRFYRIKTTLP